MRAIYFSIIVFFTALPILLAADSKEYRVSDLLNAGFLVDEHQDPLELYKDALSECAKNPQRALELAWVSARRGFAPAMHFLGVKTINVGEKLQWFFLANQMKFLETGSVYQLSFKALSDLKPSAGSLEHFCVNALEKFKVKNGKLDKPVDRIVFLIDLMRLTCSWYDCDMREKHLLFLAATTKDVNAKIASALEISPHFIGEMRSEEEALRSYDRIESIYFSSYQGLNYSNAEDSAREQKILEIILVGRLTVKFTLDGAHQATYQTLFDRMSLFPSNTKLSAMRGELLDEMLVGQNLDDDTRYERAATLYKTAGDNNQMAVEKLARLYLLDLIEHGWSGKQRQQEALRFFRKSNSVTAQKNCIQLEFMLLMDTNSEILENNPAWHCSLLYFSSDSIAPKNAAQMREMIKKMLAIEEKNGQSELGQMSLASQHFYLYFAEGAIDGDILVRARKYAMAAQAIRRSIGIEFLILGIEEFEYANKLANEETVEDSSFSPEEKSAHSDEDILLSTKAAASLSQVVDEQSVAPKQPFQKTSWRPANKHAKKFEQTKRHQRAFAENFSAQVSQFDNQSTLELVFLSGTVEKQFKMLDGNKKAEELFEDIVVKPWGTDGAGKPEVLRNGKYAGCISRRLNHEDRLVYRVMGRNKLEIMSCVGHYE